jgi:translation initiation factor IF-3
VTIWRNQIIKEKRIRVNEEIWSHQIRVVDSDGKQLGLMSPKEAIEIASQRGLDLVEIVPNATPPVCKIIDYGKFRYEQQKREKMQRKHQQVAQIKEIRLHPNIDDHDFEFKARHAKEFIEDGHKVKVSVVFKGREIAYQEFGKEILNRMRERLSEVAKVDQEAHMEGRNMIMFFVPDRSKKKVEGKTVDKQQNENVNES